MLLPKKASTFYKQTAELCNVPEELVNDLISAYWKEIRKSLSECNATQVNVLGLGVFRAKSWKIKDIIEKNEKIINSLKGGEDDVQKISFYKFSIIKDLQGNLDKILSLKKLLDEEEVQRKIIKQKRYDKKTKGNLEE